VVKGYFAPILSLVRKTKKNTPRTLVASTKKQNEMARHFASTYGVLWPSHDKVVVIQKLILDEHGQETGNRLIIGK